MAKRVAQEERVVAENQVFIRGIAYSATEEDLRKLFEEIGPLKNVSIAKDKEGKSRGFGFVKFALEADAVTAITSCQGVKLQGKPLKLEQGTRRVNEPPSKRKRKKDDDTNDSKIEAAEVPEEAEVPIKSEPKKKKVKTDNAAAAIPVAASTAPSPATIHRSRQVVVFGVPVDAPKGILLKAFRGLQPCRHLKHPLTAEFVSSSPEGEELSVIQPAGKVLLLTAGSRPEALKLLAGLQGADETSANSTPFSKKGVTVKQLNLLPLLQNRKDKKSGGKKGSIEVDNEGEGGDAEREAGEEDLLAVLKTANMQQASLTARLLSSVTPLTHRPKLARLIIRNLSFAAQEEHLLAALAPFGPLAGVELPTKEGGKGHRGFAFATFLCAEDATRLVEQGKALRVCKREVAVDFCLSKTSYLKEQQAQKEGGEDSDEMDVDQIQEDEEQQKNQEEEEHEEENEESENEEEEEESEEEEEVEENDVEEEPVAEDSNSSSMLRAGSNSSDVAEGRTVFLRGLSPDTAAEEVRAALQRYGPLTSCLIVKDRATGISKGSAFAQFASPEHARLALSKAVNGSIEVAGRKARIDLALDRDSAAKIATGQRPGRDKRNLYLANEGLVSSNDRDGPNDRDREKRAKAAADKKKKLVNPLFFVSAERLSIRNLGKELRDRDLKLLCLRAAKAGLTKGLVSLEDIRNLQLAQGPELFTSDHSKRPESGLAAVAARQYSQQDLFALPVFDGKTALVSTKVMLELPERDREDRKKIVTKDLASKGYGFVEFSHHALALACLRELNNSRDPDYEPQTAQAAGAGDKKSRLIVEFAVENFRKVQVLKERQARLETRRQQSQPPGFDPQAAAQEKLRRRRERVKESRKNSKKRKAEAAAATEVAAAPEVGKTKAKVTFAATEAEEASNKNVAKRRRKE